MKRIFPILISLAILASCGKVETAVYETPLFKMDYDKKWVVQEYPGQLLDVKNAYTFALFTLAPVQITNANDEMELQYGFTVGSYAFNKVKEGKFDENLAPFPTNPALKLLKSEFVYFQGVKARWEEAEINVPSAHNFNLKVDIPLDFGYIEIDAWGPYDDKQLADEYRALANSLIVTAKNHFKDHPEAAKKGNP